MGEPPTTAEIEALSVVLASLLGLDDNFQREWVLGAAKFWFEIHPEPTEKEAQP